MIHPGYAFKPNEAEEMRRIRDRYKEISVFNDQMEITKKPGYAHVKFEVTLHEDASEEAKALTEEDILIIADNGNLCFGGFCNKVVDGFFRGSYYTD